MPKRKKTNTQLEEENDLLRKFPVGQEVSKIINTLIKTSGTVACFYFSYKSIEVLSGKTTKSDISFIGKIATDISLQPSIILFVAILLCLGGISYGLLQRKEKQRVILHFQDRKTNLENKIDPGRKSSQLAMDGTTRIEDK